MSLIPESSEVIEKRLMCAVDGCGRRRASRGWCDMHYRRWRKHGTTNLSALGLCRLMSPADRFWLKVDKSGGPDACWPWRGAISEDGYGLFFIESRRWRTAHLVGYEFAVGAVPDGLQLDHVCHSIDPYCSGGSACSHRRCVNPAHLEPVTQAENVRRGARSKRTHCPAGHPYAGDNLMTGKCGRRCRACKNEKVREARKATRC